MKTHQSKIEKLIAELCNEGVEFKELGKIVKIKNGKDWKRLGEGNIPVYGTGGVMGYVDTFSYNKPTVLIPRKGSITNIFYLDVPFWNVDTIYYTVIDTRQVLPKFFYYVIKNIDLEKLDTGSGRPSLTQAVLDRIKIPIPPLPIQEEIVKILDTFTKLEAELEAELEARKKQYECYRDELLTFEDDVEWKTLGEVALEFGRGKSKHRPRNDSRLYGGDIPFIQTGDIRNSSHIIREYTQIYSEFGLKQSKLWPKGTLCITIAANIAETTVLGFDACFPDSIIGFIADPEKSNANFVEYLLSSFKSKLQAQSTGSAQSNIKLATFESMRFPFPSLAEQERIVTILDKFDALVNDISIGLPAELNARRKQYEYYRDKLLTFKPLKGAHAS
jgi:type I restriction enzyme, S subunit